MDLLLYSEVDAFAEFYWDPRRANNRHFQLQKHLGPPAERFRAKYLEALSREDREAKAALELFVKDLGSFTKLFEFISQIYDFAEDASIEKRYAFFKELSPLLYGIIRDGRDAEAINPLLFVMSHPVCLFAWQNKLTKKYGVTR